MYYKVTHEFQSSGNITLRPGMVAISLTFRVHLIKGAMDSSKRVSWKPSSPDWEHSGLQVGHVVPRMPMCYCWSRNQGRCLVELSDCFHIIQFGVEYFNSSIAFCSHWVIFTCSLEVSSLFQIMFSYPFGTIEALTLGLKWSRIPRFRFAMIHGHRWGLF